MPELGQADIRETYLRSYRIVYRTDGQDLWVLTVFEGSCQLRASGIDDGSRERTLILGAQHSAAGQASRFIRQLAAARQRLAKDENQDPRRFIRRHAAR